MKTIANPFRLGTVERLYEQQGALVADVYTTEGAVFRGVPLRRLGEGSQMPPRAGETVHLYFPDGAYDLPYVVGVDVVDRTLATEDTTPSGNYRPSIYDTSIRHAQSRLSLSRHGVTIESDSSVRVQLQSGEVLRVSVDGVSEDSPLKGQAFIDALFSLLTSFEQRLVAVETANAIPPNPLNPTASSVKVSCEATKSVAVTLT